MAIVDLGGKANSIEIRGKLGKPNELGDIWCGWSELGEYLPIAGIYQKRRNKKGQIFVRMKHYHGSNPQTPEQQSNRATFSQAVASWQSLDESEKKQWRAKKHPRYMSGYNRYIRDYMRGLVS